MHIWKKFIALVFILVLIGCGEDDKSENPELDFVQIGTGSTTGVYYPTGGAIAKIVNKKSQQYNLQVSVLSTSGSVYNVNALIDGDLEFGIIQSDRQAEAWTGTGEWSDKGTQEDLRSVFSIHSESVSLLAAVDASISSIEDLKGKNVNIGNLGSGQRSNALHILEYHGIDWEEDMESFSMKQTEAVKMLLEGRIDALFYTVGHPSATFKEATGGRREVAFVPLTDIRGLLDQHSYYTRSSIPVEFYPRAANDEDVPTFGVKATLCTVSSVSDETVYALVKEIFDNFDEFKSLHPAFSRLSKETMLQGLSAPLHEGAVRYYREIGLLD